jgi:SAM-dependent methyltransferase
MSTRSGVVMGWIMRNVPAPIVTGVRYVLRAVTGEPQVGSLVFGQLRRTRPLTKDFGVARGGAVDRYYVEEFLKSFSGDIRGRVLEIGDDGYTRRYGDTRVEHRDVLHVSDKNPRATIVADLADAPQIPDETFDCIILTQTLQYIFRAEAAVATLHRILRPGGVLLLTVPGITPVITASEWGPTWYWSFTRQSVGRLLEERFAPPNVTCMSRGNVLTATALLYGISTEELTAEELEADDPDYQVIVTARAVRQPGEAEQDH